MREVQRRCLAAGVAAPGREAITARVRARPAREVAATRAPIQRPWLTLAIDVCTRCVAGFHLTLEPPSATSVALCLSHAALAKEHWLAERGIDAESVRGIPERLHLDNAKEFRSEALKRGCEQYGIAVDHRPVRTPHYGDHIERLHGRKAALGVLEDLLASPKRTRMPNLLLVGPTNNGKTMIVEKFRRAHPGLDAADTADGVALAPVVKVQMPAGPDEGRLFGAVLDALGMRYAPRDRLAAKQDSAIRTLRATGARLLVIDELHNLLSGTAAQQRRLLNLLRWLGNERQIPLVGVGTAEALRAVRSDDQLANRFEPFALPLWTNDDAYHRLLSTLEAVLPLRRPSGLAEPNMAAEILGTAEGVLGEIIATVTRAAVFAVRSGAEAITLRTIDGCGFIRPSERRRVAV